MDDSERPAPREGDEVERLFEAARGLPPGDRAAYVRERVAGSPVLAEEVLSLLEHADAADRFFRGLGMRLRAQLDDVEGSPELGGSSSADERLSPGAVVGRYRVLEWMASGGMGTVYRAHDPTLHRDVALKLLPRALALDPEARERFFLEARAAAALDHPHVCTVHEVGESEEGRPFLAMALYRGETLKARVSRGSLPVEEAVAVALAVARGLAAAHAQGIVHRDVKPGNVMLTPDGGVKLLDFGVAQMTAVSWPETGPVAGTPAYMPPEQIRGEPVDARADLWALGVMLHEMIAGVRPFQGDDDRRLLHAILHEEPDALESLGPETPPQVARVVARLLRKAPGERFSSAEEVARKLEAVLASGGAPGTGAEHPAPSVPTRSLSASRLRALVVAVSLALVVSTAVLWRGSGGDPTPLHVAVLPFLAVGDEPTSPALSDDMTDAVRELLGRAGGFRILGSASAAAFADRPADLRHLADSLRVAFVVGGSVLRSGPILGVRVWVLDGRDGAVRWSGSFDREMGEVFQVQQEIARAVSAELRGPAGAPGGLAPARPPTGSLAVYELYLRASDRTVLRNDSTAREALEAIRRAVALDSSYAAAWSTLARLTLRVELLPEFGVSAAPAGEVLARAEDAALRAISLDASLAEAHYVLGGIRMVQLDFVAAEDHLHRASVLDPTSTLALETLVRLHLWAGRPERALAAAERALQLDPLSPSAHAELARALMADGRCDEALVRLGRIATLDPPLLRAGSIAAQCHALAGRWAEALAALDGPGADRNPFQMAERAHILARSGRQDEALRILDDLIEAWRSGGRTAFPVAIVYAGFGSPDETFRWLDRALDDGILPVIPGITPMDPLFQEVHVDPRFERFRARLGFQNR